MIAISAQPDEGMALLNIGTLGELACRVDRAAEPVLRYGQTASVHSSFGCEANHQIALDA
jgi:hypothetical protein